MNQEHQNFVSVSGAREHNLKDISVKIPRDCLVVFTGICGSGKSLAFSTLYAEAQRRYLESVSPYARRLFNQMAVPDVNEITGMPPALALQQQTHFHQPDGIWYKDCNLFIKPILWQTINKTQVSRMISGLTAMTLQK